MRVPLDQWHQLPDGPGVYFFYGADDQLLYVGKSVHLRQRVRSYLRAGGGHSSQTERLKFEAETVAIQSTGSELAALLLENQLIKTHLPPFNRAQRRWRHYPFLRLDVHDPFPRLEVTRQLKDDGAEYYGPYRDRHYLTGLVKHLSILLGLRTCQDLSEIHQGCLLDQLDRCSAPCRNHINPIAYQERVEQLRRLLTGEGAAQLLTQAETRMHQAAEQEHFELAARWRDRHQTLQHFIAHQRWRKNQVILDVCAIQPGDQPGECAVFWLRGGCLHSTQVFRRAEHVANAIAQTLEQFQEPSLPMYRLPQHQLDEFHILATWLYRHQQAPEVIWLQEPAPQNRILAQIQTMLALKGPQPVNI